VSWSGELTNRVLVEAGTASGRQPVAIVDLRSYLGEFLQETDVSLGADDEGSFRLPLLHSGEPSSRILQTAP